MERGSVIYFIFLPTMPSVFGLYDQFHNILRLFDVLLNFPFTTSETMGDEDLSTWYTRVASQVAERLKN